MPFALFGVALTIGLVLLARGFLMADPRTLAQILRWTGGAVAVVVVALLIESGREGLLFPVAVMVAPLAFRWATRRRWFGLGEAAAPAPGRSSRVDTRHLRMTLDHDSGVLSGEVLAGRFQGRALATLAFDEVMELLDECRREDPQSVTVLETWLDRVQGADWRTRAAAPPAPPPDGPMNREEALAILGLQSDATAEAIKEAHHHLMTKVHPDHGGSTWLAAKLNQARDLLLRS